ncbi:hypothetical protein T11_7954 [Trichinella zimbabwensis]|uniref:Uncharacterized protein n=2 Tax=Trichinella zimbabwensis TaxID=268475 RepID=A0A0V1GRJ0_9BILA|nr:hypothetical protein T11_7954 [Trichinella zimbabwensis]
MTLIIMLGFEKLFIILRTLIIRKTIQCTASHHTFTQQNSVNSISIIFSYLMLCYGYTHIIKSDAEHKRNSHDMKLNTSYPRDQNEVEIFHDKKQVFRNPSYAYHTNIVIF